MNSALHQEIARARQADIVRGTRFAQHEAEVPGRERSGGRLEALAALAAGLSRGKRARTRRPVFGVAR